MALSGIDTFITCIYTARYKVPVMTWFFFFFFLSTSSFIYAHVFIALNTLAFHGYVFDMCLLSCIDIYISMLLCICLLHLVSRPIPKGVGRSCKHILDLWGCVSRLGRPFMSTEL